MVSEAEIVISVDLQTDAMVDLKFTHIEAQGPSGLEIMVDLAEIMVDSVAGDSVMMILIMITTKALSLDAFE